MKKFTLFFMSLFLTVGAMAQTTQKVEIDLTTTAGQPGYVSSPHDHAVINPNSQWDKGGVAALIDGRADTHFHTAWENVPTGPHYFQVDLGEGNTISDFSFNYILRKDGGDDFPSQFTIKGSNDDADYERITVIDITMPNSAGEAQGKSYSFDVTDVEKEYRYLRFEVTNTKSYNGGGYRTYFHLAEFDLFKIVTEALPEYTVTYNYSYNGNVAKTVTHTVVEGSPYPAHDLNIFGASYADVPTGTVTENKEVTITVTFDLPFEFAATYDDIDNKWYYLSIGQAAHLLYHVDNAANIALNKTEVDADNKYAYQWAFVGSPFDGYKLVNRAKGNGWVLSSSTNTFDNNTGGNTYPIMTEEPVGDGKNTYWIATASTDLGDGGFYLAQKDANNGNNKMNNRDNKLAYWNGGADHGSTFKARHIDAIDPVTFNWTATTQWTAVDAADCTSSLMWDNKFSEGIKYIQSEIAVDSPVEGTVTFVYTDGGCRLNMTGVEVIDAEGNIVSCDYHIGFAGGAHENNIYSVKVAEAGTYTVRCYATEGDWSDEKGNHTDLFNNTNGRITANLAKTNSTEFTHDVTFAAEYATLYLGYKVAVPAGVEAYVVKSTNNGHAQMEKVEGVIPANTAVILKKVGTENTYTFAYAAGDAATVEANLLKGSIANRYVIGDACVLSNGAEGIGLYGAILNQLDNTAFLNNAFKAYLEMPASQGTAAFYGFDWDGTTGIDEVTTENGEVKAIYDLTGRKVEAITAPGIYIVNGKKVLVK